MQTASNKSIPFGFLIMIVALISMMAPFSIDTYLPSFPTIEAELGVSRALLTQSLAIYLGFFAVATLAWGPMSDKWGRKKIILSSLVGYVVASLICAMANSYETLMLGRSLQGMAAAGSLVASRAMIRDAFKQQEAQKAMALVMMLFAVAPAVAPIIGGWLQVHSGWRSVFYFLTVYALIILVLFLAKVPETQDPDHVQSIHPVKIIQSYWDSILHPEFLKLVVAQGLIVGGFFVYIAGSTSLIFDHLQLKEQDFWMFFVPVVSGIVIGSFLSHRISHRFNAITIINLGFGLGLVSVVANVILQSKFEANIWLVVLPLMFYALAFSLLNPVLSIVTLDCLPTKRGMASSVQSLFQMGSAALAAAFVVPYVHESLQYMAISQAMMLVISIGLWLGVMKGIKAKKSA